MLAVKKGGLVPFAVPLAIVLLPPQGEELGAGLSYGPALGHAMSFLQLWPPESGWCREWLLA